MAKHSKRRRRRFRVANVLYVWSEDRFLTPMNRHPYTDVALTRVVVRIW